MSCKHVKVISLFIPERAVLKFHLNVYSSRLLVCYLMKIINIARDYTVCTGAEFYP